MAPDSEGEVTQPQPVLWLIARLRGSTLWHLPSEPALSSELGSPVHAEYWFLPTLCIYQHQKVLPCTTAPPGKGYWAIFRPWPLGPTGSPGLTMTSLFLQPVSTPQSLSSQKMAPPLSTPGHFLESPPFLYFHIQYQVLPILCPNHAENPALLSINTAPHSPSPQTTTTASEGSPSSLCPAPPLPFYI